VLRAYGFDEGEIGRLKAGSVLLDAMR